MLGAGITLPISQAGFNVDFNTHTMHHLRKLKPSADSPPLIPSPPAKAVRKLTSRRDPKTLGATSSAIALSISSAFRDLGGTPRDGPTDQEGEARWQAVCATIRMAVEVTKESSDLCLPLKAVVGAIFVLVKNYDVSVSWKQSGNLLTLYPFPVPANHQ